MFPMIGGGGGWQAWRRVERGAAVQVQVGYRQVQAGQAKEDGKGRQGQTGRQARGKQGALFLHKTWAWRVY